MKITTAILIVLFSRCTAFAASSLLYAVDNDRVDYGTPSTLNDISTGTVCLWLYPTDDTARQTVFRKNTGAVAGEIACVWDAHVAGDDFGISRNRIPTPVSATASAANFANYGINKWLFLCAQWEFGSTSTNQKILIGDFDSVLAEPSSYVTQTAGSGTDPTDAAESLLVGNTGFSLTREFHGSIAAVYIWRRLLSLAEMTESQFSGNVKGTVLKVYQGFNGTGTQYDQSGNANNGTVTGATVSSNGPPISFPTGAI